MVIFSIAYMTSEPNLDAFNLQEALEYIHNKPFDYPHPGLVKIPH
jgi:hypothetical protein